MPEPAVNTTVWSGAEFVTVMLPEEVTGFVPASDIPVPAVSPIDVTVPTFQVLSADKSKVVPLIVILRDRGT